MTGCSDSRWPQVSSICDADKSLPVLDPGIRLLVPGRSLHGPARTVLAIGDHLPVLTALALARPGEVLVSLLGGCQDPREEAG